MLEADLNVKLVSYGAREEAARIGGMDRQTLRDWVNRCQREESITGLAGLLLSPASEIHIRATLPLAAVCIIGSRCSVRSNDVGRRAERTARRIERGSPHKPGRGCFWQ
jgi:hypothetical protein